MYRCIAYVCESTCMRIVPCARRNGAEWRRDVQIARGGKKAMRGTDKSAPANVHPARRRGLGFSTLILCNSPTISGPRGGERDETGCATCTFTRAKTRRVIYTYEKMLQKTRRSPRLKRRSCRRDNKRRQWMRFPKQECTSRQGR